MEDNEFWNPILETLHREKLQKLQLRKFQNIFRWAYEHSKFHRRLYRDAGLEPGDIKSFDDIRKVPKIEKSMMREIQGKDPYPYGDMLCVPLEKVTEYHQTSGTTGQPIYQADTWQDWEWWAEAWAYILFAQGYRDQDRVFLPFGYNVFVAFWAAHYGAEKVGCEVVPGGTLNTEARILKMQELRATAMMATPTYVLGMADTARSKLGIDPATALQIKKITVAGEPGGSIPETRRRMEEAWGAKVYDHVGATEIGAWSYECTHQCGVHVNEALFLVEIEDIDTGIPITQPGKKGKMVITALDRMGQPCIRFDSKDIIEWSADECECGRTFRLLKGGVSGRTDDLTKVKGVLLSPTSIEEAVRGIPELSNDYEVIVSKEVDIDNIRLRVEIMPGQKHNIETVRARLVDQLRLKTNLGYDLEFCDYGTLPRYDVKARRFKDLRHQE
ncbi:MAG: phenylacetate--CoA ligase family protein [Chloroflexi bacterium]|nr:phenylacetate--CoA ligase family protein [Chloroflexota bacterium]MBI4267536.1 phenylacetate--CoA ligase family protein [Chloroflexota bacterium]